MARMLIRTRIVFGIKALRPTLLSWLREAINMNAGRRFALRGAAKPHWSRGLVVRFRLLL